MDNLKSIREEKNLTQVALAAKVGVSLSTVRLWEAGAGKPNEENYKKLLAALEILPFEEE